MPKFIIPIKIIAAIDINNGLGKNGKLLYRIPKDMKHFKSNYNFELIIIINK